MGAWGASLYANDVTCDVRDTYMKYLQEQVANEEAYQNTLEQFHEYIVSEDEPLFWYALADTQWKLGRLMPEVKSKSLEWIAKDGGIENWEESKNGGVGWIKTLQKLKIKLESPMPQEKVVKKPVVFVQNPWNVGDVYAYQFHTDIAQTRGLFGKYILFQKISNDEWYERCVLSIIQVFDKIYEDIPVLSDIEGVRVLPLSYPPGYKWMPKSKEDFVPSFESCLRSLMTYYKKSDYPIKHLTFIGNENIADVKYERIQYSVMPWQKDGMDDWLSDYYLCWHGVEY